MVDRPNKNILKTSKPYKYCRAEVISFVLFAKKHSTINTKGEEERDTKQKKKKSTWVFLLFNFIIVGIILSYTIITQDAKPISELLKETPYFRYIFIGLLMMVLF